MTIPKIGALRRTQAKGNSTTKICSLCTLLLIKTSSLLTLKSTVVEYLVEKLTKVELQSLKRGREEGEKRDRYYERGTGIGDFEEWDTGNSHLNEPRTEMAVDENL